MIFNILIRNESNDFKNIMLTAQNTRDLYRRVLSQYGIVKECVEILEEYDENNNYKLIKTYKNNYKQDDLEYVKKAREMYYNGTRKGEPFKTKTAERCRYSIVDISSYQDVVPLLKKYSRVEVHWEPTEKRGEHKYYAMYR